MFDHGQLVYLQIPATDITMSARFYERVLSWQVDPPEAGFEAPGLIGQWITDRRPAPDAGPVMWIHVDDVARTLGEAERAGATLRQEPTPDGPRLLASFSDPAGNLVGIVAHGAQDPARPAAAATPTATVSATPTAGVENRTMPPCTIIPELVYDDVIAAMHWLSDAFGFEERWHVGDHRAQLSFGSGTIAITEPRTSSALPGPISLLVRVDDVDAHHAHAREHGAKILDEPRDFPYGERQYAAEDPGGHHWGFSQSIADVAPEEWGGTSGPALRATTPGAAAISVMLIVPDAGAAVTWYREALGADVLWDLGGVAGLEVGGAPFFLHEVNAANPAEDSPDHVGQTSVRIEVFVQDPGGLIERALAAGARQGSPVTAHELPWGTHRQGGFEDPFGHRWSVGDTSPLRAHGG